MTQQPARAYDDSLRARMDQVVQATIGDIDSHRRAMRLLPLTARPLVLDANMLRGEVRSLYKLGHDTALVTLAKIGMVSLYAAQHVFDEVEEHAERWTTEMRLPLDVYLATWRTVLKPLIGPTEFSSGLLTRAEQARVARLAQPKALGGDPDDVPTAIVAMVLEAPLLSSDTKLLRAVYGEDYDVDMHRGYVQALFGGGRVLVISEMGWAVVALIRLAFLAMTSSVRAVSSRTGSTALVAASAAAAAAAATSPRLRTRLRELAPPALAAWDALLEVATFYYEAERNFDALVPPLPWSADEFATQSEERRRAARNAALLRPETERFFLED